jgi:hypothetical protein
VWFYCIEKEEDDNFRHLLRWLYYKEMATFAFFWWFCCKKGDDSNVVAFLYGGGCFFFLIAPYGLIHYN